jgi:hypothetical protein
MFVASLLIVVFEFQPAPASAAWPPRTSIEELNAMVKAGNYHLIRKEKLGYQIETVAVVEKVGRWPVLKLPGKWWAPLHNLPADHGLKPGDRVKFRALIVDEGYKALQLWTYSWNKEPGGNRAAPEEKVGTDKSAIPSPHKGSDVELIANWLRGKDPGKAFARPFGDRQLIVGNKGCLLYTDIAGVETPDGMKAVNYEFVQARMHKIRRGQEAAPAVLIVRSSLEEPSENGPVRSRLDKGKPAGRVYYIEVAIGNLAWHWLKVVVHDEDDRPKAEILWAKVS